MSTEMPLGPKPALRAESPSPETMNPLPAIVEINGAAVALTVRVTAMLCGELGAPLATIAIVPA